ncbi:hypothetical protein ACHAWF_015898 [Thalassiosira exigua]
MDREWDGYYDALEEYKAATGIDPEEGSEAAPGPSADPSAASASSKTGAEDLSSFFSGGTLAIDVGTARIKLAHRPSLANRKLYKDGKPPSPTVCVDREGHRSTPSAVWFPRGEVGAGQGEDDVLVGRLAEARAHDQRGGRIVRPLDLWDAGSGAKDAEAAMSRAVRAVASNALEQALGGAGGGGGGGSSKSEGPLFVLDLSLARGGAFNVRPVFVHPPVPSDEDGADWEAHLNGYRRMADGLASPPGVAAYVPDAAAAVVGADHAGLLPPTDAGSSVLVMDVGGTSTCVSVVDGSAEVKDATTLPFGGDTFVDVLVSHLVAGFYGIDEGAEIGSDADVPSAAPRLDDPAALQRLYEASRTAVHELSSKTRSEVNVPYLTMDFKTRQPKHLAEGVARDVVDAAFQSYVRDELAPYLLRDPRRAKALSAAFPPPADLAGLLSSTILSSLERAKLAPTNLRAALLVGGGARVPLVRRATQEGLARLAGDAFAYGTGGGRKGARLVMPEGGAGEELVALGAAVWCSGGRSEP